MSGSRSTACASSRASWPTSLVFIKHLPHCQPNITYARELTNKWDDIQNDEFNLPRPSRRKKLKRQA